MEIKKIRAIFDELRFENVQKALMINASTNFSTQYVEEMGENDNRANSDVLITKIQIEIYISAKYAKKVAELIELVASANGQNEVVVLIETLEGLFGTPRKLIT